MALRPTTPVGLWSLWDMPMKLGHYVMLLDDLRGTEATFKAVNQPDVVLDDQSKNDVRDLFAAIQAVGRSGVLERSTVAADCGLAETEDDTCTYRDVAIRLRHTVESFSHDANQRVFWLIHGGKAKYFNRSFGKEVNAAFPDVIWEVREASSCYALARNTACVFHLMRSVELGMRALAVAVGVTPTKIPLEYQEWNNLIEQIESHAKAIDSWGRGPEVTNARQFFKRIIADLYSFKDDVRNVTMHTRRKPYDSPGALSVRNRVKEWFEILATKVRQDAASGAAIDRSLFAP
jgi:hypothetical protein